MKKQFIQPNKWASRATKEKFKKYGNTFKQLGGPTSVNGAGCILVNGGGATFYLPLDEIVVVATV